MAVQNDEVNKLENRALVYLSGQYAFGSGAIGATALTTANSKVNLGFGQAFVLGILCNGLVCLAVWLSYSARSTADKILAIIPPIAAFVASGFEHSIANMYFIPIALFIKMGAPEAFWSGSGNTMDDFPNLTWQNFSIGNLLPVTLGNIVGGAVLVGAVYWFVYLRTAKPVASSKTDTPTEHVHATRNSVEVTTR